MNLTQIRTRVRSLTGIRSASLLSDAEIDEAVNEFNYNLLGAYEWPQLVGVQTLNTAALYDGVAYPSSASQIVGVETDIAGLGRRTHLRGVSLTEYNMLTSTVSGKPEIYVADAMLRTVKFWPRPDAEYPVVVHFKRRVSRMAADSDIPVLEEEFHLMWAQAAASSLLKSRAGDASRINNLDVRVNASIARARKMYLMNPDRMALPLPDRWS